MKFEVIGKPQGKARARTFYNNKTGHMQSVTPEKTVSYEDLIRYEYRAAGGTVMLGALSVHIKIYMPIPACFNKRQRLSALAGEMYPINKPDNDNVEKVVFDALNGIAYRDDTQIVENTAVKLFSDEPRLAISIEPAKTAWAKLNGKYVRTDE